MEQNIHDLEAQIKALEAKKLELEKLKRELPTIATVHSFTKSTGKIKIKLNKFNDRAVDVLRRIPSRVYTQDDNIISVMDLKNAVDGLKLNGIKVHCSIKLLIEIKKYMSQPDLTLEISNQNKSKVRIVLGPKALGQRLYLAQDIQSWTQDWSTNSYNFSLAEVYKFPTSIEKHYPGFKIEYSQELKPIMEAQIERRSKLFALADAKDVPDVPNPFSGIDPKTGEKYDLKPMQRVAVKFSELVGDNVIIAYPMGKGKTAIASAIAQLRGYKKVLIICPANLKTNWKYFIKDFLGVDALVLSGSEPDKMAIENIIHSKYRFYIINYDIISRSAIDFGEEDDKNQEQVNKWVLLLNAAGFDLLVGDEIHRIKNIGSNRSKAVRQIKIPHNVLLSGTPIVNRPNELWPPLFMIDREVFTSFDGFSNQFMWPDKTPKNLPKLQEVLSDRLLRRTPEQFGDSIDPTRIPHYKELGNQAKINYDKVLQGVYTSLRNPKFTTNVTSILAELTRCKQICSADNVEATVDLALEALDETEKKVIIGSQFIESQIDIKKQLGNTAAIVNGQVDDDTRYAIFKEFQDPKSSLKFIVTNVTEGITLTEAWTVIANDLWWTAKDHDQLEGRAFGRVNDPHSGNSYFLLNKNTIDEFIFGLIEQKRALSKEVIDGVSDEQGKQQSIAMALLHHLRSKIV